jgi:hypothetical protein
MDAMKRAVPVAVTQSDSIMRAATTRHSPTKAGHPIRLSGRSKESFSPQLALDGRAYALFG